MYDTDLGYTSEAAAAVGVRSDINNNNNKIITTQNAASPGALPARHQDTKTPRHPLIDPLVSGRVFPHQDTKTPRHQDTKTPRHQGTKAPASHGV